jgi:UDP-N-acetylglucosamine:LPS N-acetylglucosamine transferase
MGGGHMNLAQSLQELLAEHYNVVIVDPQPASVDRWYTLVSRYSLKFLEWQYIYTDNKIASQLLHYLFTLSSQQRLQDVIEQIQPQLIITTHAQLSYAVARVNERCRQRVPLVFQLTDLGQLHLTWFTEKHADAYLAPTREIFAQAQEQGIASDRLHLTGRPIRSQFLAAPPSKRDETLASLNLDPGIFTICLQGGAKGSAAVDHMIDGLLTSQVPMQIILAAGNNKRMLTRYAHAERVRALPFTEKIASYMAAADIIAGKAGASFISEAFMLEKPFFVTTFIPGQETPNLRFIRSHNLGWVCPEPTAQRELLCKIADNPKLITEKAESIRRYKLWNKQANQNIPLIINQLLPHAVLSTKGMA